MTWIRLRGQAYNTDQIAMYYQTTELVLWPADGPSTQQTLVICLNGSIASLSDPSGDLFRKLDAACSPVDLE